MTTPLHLGKLRGLKKLADECGHFRMVALDQRPPIANLIAAKRGIAAADVSFADMLAVKRLFVEELPAGASAMLLDPNFAFPAALAQLPARTGLLVTLEEHRFRETPGGRLSHSIADWSVEKIKRAGGDGVKVLAWYRPDAAAGVVSAQQHYVQQVGEECRRWDIPFVLELLVYPLQPSAGEGADYVEAPQKQPPLVIESVREFAKPQYGVDLFKLESPLPGAGLPARDGSAAHHDAQRQFDELGAICRNAKIPWVMLSAGVTAAQFQRVMAYAYAAGAHGFLAGRAIWWEALQAFPDLEACRKALRAQGRATLEQLGASTREAATAWHADYSLLEAMQREGELCAAYR